MKNFVKIPLVLVSVFMFVTVFAACGKDEVNIAETTDESTTVSYVIDDVTEATAATETTEEVTTKISAVTIVTTTNKVSTTIKVPATTKNVNTTKAPETTKTVETTNGSETSKPKETTTKTELTTKEDFIAPNYSLLVGTWDARIEVEGLPVEIQFEFSIFGKTVDVDFTKSSYDNMTDKAVEMELDRVTDEEITEAGFADRAEYEVALRAYLLEELPYEELRSLFRSTGTWELIGDELTVVIGGETMTADTKLSEDVKSFELVDAYGETMTLVRR
ncbi:MAG: hypothetical protein IIW48_11835 [Clostridia bacterium]|nr:hypothetical protein [Clostridia bacterium]